MSAPLSIELTGPVQVAAEPPAGRGDGFQDVLGQQLSGFELPQRAPGRNAHAQPDEVAPDATLPFAAPSPETLPLASLAGRRVDVAGSEPGGERHSVAAAVVAATPAPNVAPEQAFPLPSALAAEPTDAARTPVLQQAAHDAPPSEPGRAASAAPPLPASSVQPGAGETAPEQTVKPPDSPRPEAAPATPVSPPPRATDAAGTIAPPPRATDAAGTIAPPPRATDAAGTIAPPPRATDAAGTIAPPPRATDAAGTIAPPPRTSDPAETAAPRRHAPGVTEGPAPRPDVADVEGAAPRSPTKAELVQQAFARTAGAANQPPAPAAEAVAVDPQRVVPGPAEAEPRLAELTPVGEAPGRAAGANPTPGRPDVQGPAPAAVAAGAKSDSGPEADVGERHAPPQPELADAKLATDTRPAADPRASNAAPVAEAVAIERLESRAADPIPAPRGSSTSDGIAGHVQWLVREGGGSARVRLNPPSLGEIELHVRLRGGVVDVRVMALDPAAQKALAGERAALAQGLALRDLRMEGFTVTGPAEADGGLDADAGAERKEGRPTRDAGSPGPAWRTGGVAGAATAETAHFAPPAAQRDNALDLRA